MMKPLPEDIEVLLTEEKAYIEIEGFIRFLRLENIDPEYRAEEVHLKRIADYLSEHLKEAIEGRKFLSAQRDTEKLN